MQSWMLGIIFLICNAEYINTNKSHYEEISCTSSEYVDQVNCDKSGVTLSSPQDGGWDITPASLLLAEGPCTIDVLSVDSLPLKKFIEDYAYTKPFIVQGASRNKVFQTLTRKDRLLSTHGSSIIRLSSANSHSYDRQFMIFEDYCDKNISPQSIDTLANETFYFFGDNSNSNWNELHDSYNPPPYHLPGHQSQLSFGVAGSGSGVPFHFHGPGFAETLWGRKRWFMYNPEGRPSFHPNRTTLQWLHEQYPQIKNDPLFTECTLHPGEIIYFPDHWWHATLNLDTAVFMSTFFSP